MKMPRLSKAFTLIALDSIGSTNDEARRLATEGADDGTVVWAREQHSGRGRRGREWVSRPGNLYCSILLRPHCPPAEAAQLSFVAALALADALTTLLPPACQPLCKWPNDVLVDGRKIAGLLLEAAGSGQGGVSWLVLGAGVNVAHHPEGTELPATSLAALGVTADAAVMLEALTEAFATWRDRWREQGFASIRAAWLARASGLGAPIRVRLASETLTGRFGGLDADGALLLEIDGATTPRRIAAGDVFLV